VTQNLTFDQLRAAPKVALHDHLDGGLRPATVLDLADEVGHELPAHDVETLERWFHEGAARRDLPTYLTTFAHTVAVMQTPEHLERVAYESAVDLAADGVPYAELRYAPELNTDRGLSLDDVLEATTAGFDRAMRDRDIVVRTIVAAMRTEENSTAAATAAVRWADRGVVAFDLAGAEDGYPPAKHLDAIRTAREGGLHITIHAGEAYGLPSIEEAVVECGAERLGHGVRIVEDVAAGDDGAVLGPVATRVRDEGIALEVCPSSNVHTGAVASLAAHPVDRLLDLGFRVTVNTDNRLMSATTTTEEFATCVDTFGWGRDRVEQVLRNGVAAAFCSDDERRRLGALLDAWVAGLDG
jgi:adenosine deaminase